MLMAWVLAASLLPLAAWAQQPAPPPRPPAPPSDQIATPGRPGWTVDARNGCWVWNPNPQPGEAVTWSGRCPRGPAEGNGRGEWRWTAEGRAQVETFSGALRNGRLEGRGVVTWPNGNRYDGEWRDGRQHGRGVLTGPNGNRYDGEWRDDRQNGRGVFTWPDGSRSDGEWRDGRPDGSGTYTTSAGIYTGTWVGGCFRDASGFR